MDLFEDHVPILYMIPHDTPRKWVCLIFFCIQVQPQIAIVIGKSMVSHWILGVLYFQTNLNNW